MKCNNWLCLLTHSILHTKKRTRQLSYVYQWLAFLWTGFLLSQFHDVCQCVWNYAESFLLLSLCRRKGRIQHRLCTQLSACTHLQETKISRIKPSNFYGRFVIGSISCISKNWFWKEILCPLLMLVSKYFLPASKWNWIGQQRFQWSRHMVNTTRTVRSPQRREGDTCVVFRWSIHGRVLWTTCVCRYNSGHAGWNCCSRGTYGTVRSGIIRMEPNVWYKVGIRTCYGCLSLGRICWPKWLIWLVYWILHNY